MCFEPLEERSNPVAFANIFGSVTVRDMPMLLPTEVAVSPLTQFAFVGPVLSVPDPLTDGRTVTVTFADGATTVGQLIDAGGNRTDILVARNLPRSGIVSGEIRLVKRDDPTDRIVIGFQLAIVTDDVSTTSPQAFVQSTPTYALGGELAPTVPPSVSAPRPAAPISQAPFQAGATFIAYDDTTIRGARTVVPLTNVTNSSLTANRVELAYSFLRSSGPIEVDSFPGRAIPVSYDPTATTEPSKYRSAANRLWASSEVHGVAVESEMAIVELRGVLEQIAQDDVHEAIWMTEPVKEADERPSDRRPLWAVAVLVGLGVTQLFRRRESAVPELAVL
jgi:hypothetical protein